MLKEGAVLTKLGLDDFARRFALRAGSLMWLLGAGASAAAGVPTAGDMVWEFKQRLFVSQRRVSLQSVSDLASAAIREQLDAHLLSAGNLPLAGDPDEYAALFEAVYPSEADRRAYLDAKMAGASPSFGHMALATLMRAGLTRLVLTTNFDPLVADACAKVYGGTGFLSTVTLDAPGIASQLIGQERWPIEIKLHGDFRSRRLKNTGDELRECDAELRRVAMECCGRFGLVVAGYSGRDDSVMDTLETAISSGKTFPAGLFWLHHGQSPPLPRVRLLLEQARDAGLEAALVEVENFDETLRDLVRLIGGLDTGVLEQFAKDRRRWTPAPLPVGGHGWPVVRLNCLPVTESPAVCRRVVCGVGGYKEARQAVESAGVDVLVARTAAGVLAFGSDSAVRSAFAPYGITDFGLHTIEQRRLRYDSGERGLLKDALSRALARQHALTIVRRRASDFFSPTDPKAQEWAPLQRLVGDLSGSVKGHDELLWREGIVTHLEWAADRLWLLFEPRIVFEGINVDNRAASADFSRERTVKRYNRQLNELIAFWAQTLSAGEVELRALQVSDGVDAVFRLSSQTGYSRRAKA